ncbi:MAG: Alcohol dehydrogenase zinc-binding domain protein [Variovorax sp.]|nr:Alcohol dehydrogenase zinc-binding domain protein [Variovorax sp.]
MNDPLSPDDTPPSTTGKDSGTMLSCGIDHFGPPEAIHLRRIARPVPRAGQLLVRIAAAGVGPWDAWVRAGQSTRVLEKDLPATLGSDISGIVESVGEGVTSMLAGDAVYGVTNASFTGGYAEFALADSAMMSNKPCSLDFVAAASVPVIGCTAWQMLFEHADLKPGQRVLILGAAGNVGAFAVQLARWRGATVIATGSAAETARLLRLGALDVIDARATAGPLPCGRVDVVIDTVGGELQSRAMLSLGEGGVLVSAVSEPDAGLARSVGARGVFFIVDVTAACLARLAAMIDAGDLETYGGAVLPLREARVAHEMLDGLRARPPGKIVLAVPGG